MPKLTKKAIRLGRTDGRTDPNYKKDSLLKIEQYQDMNWLLVETPPPTPIKK